MGEDEAIRQELADVINAFGLASQAVARPMSGSRCPVRRRRGLHRP